MVSGAANGDHPLYEVARRELEASLRYQHPDYYVAICPCYQDTITFSEQPESNITYANIFVNSNYEFYKEKYIEVYKEYDVHLVTHKDTNLDNLPFKVEKFYPIEYNAWVLNRDLPDQILSENPEGKLFLFAAGGPLLTSLHVNYGQRIRTTPILMLDLLLILGLKLNA